ncbi:hypothetical protein H072_834 [Dactylellina haptotyla CBS 200.50]|uniref:Capsule polysaccharide biosynthesis protein n=1 Tax=Dactylellina haptotyla (strain CBS 200.50) TaxID=1284197 RepID=S8CBS7_DACHA|nr:hypothetical protein H072_834 [Dactylellina haptotyla CBS 200.50]
MASKLMIPEEFKSQIHYVDSLDSRSDGEIINSLNSHNPAISEKNIWAYWHAGLTAMPGWCQRNVANWARLCGSSWNIHVLNSVRGLFAGSMSVPTLQHGGVYMDVGIILIRPLDHICWKQLENPVSPYQISIPWMYGSVSAGHFVASRKGDPFIKAWHDLFTHLWKGRTNHLGIGMDPLVAFCQTRDLGFSESKKRGFAWKFKVDAFTVMQYIGQVISWLRLCMIDGGGEETDLAQYAKDHIQWYDVLGENFGAETVIGFVGQPLFDALSN